MNEDLPYSPDAERSVLGSALLSEKALYASMESLTEADFYRPEHRKIFRAITRLFERKRSVDAVSLIEELRSEGVLDEVGGPEYIAELVESVLSPELVGEHIQILAEKSILRELSTAAGQIIAEVKRGQKGTDELLDWAETKILEIRSKRLKRGFRPIGEISEETFHKLENLVTEQVRPGLPTGYPDLDDLLGGLRPGEMILLAARPSVGKTTLMLNIHRNLSVERKIPTAIFTLEMSSETLAMKLLALEGGVDFSKLTSGHLGRKDLEALAKAVSKLKDAPLYLDDTPNIPINELRAKARRVVHEKGVRLISVDYIQIVRGPRVENRQQAITYLSQSLKALARELEIPLLVISQLNRNPEREDRPPRLSDLRESGALEQDADVVMFLHPVTSSTEDTQLVEVLVRKNRNGPQGRRRLVFIKPKGKFESAAPEELDYAAYEDLDF